MRLVLPAVLLAVAAAMTGCGGGPEATRDEAGAVATAGAVDAFSVQPGDCLQQPEATSDGTSAVEDVEVVPCAQPHDAEVFSVSDLPDGDYPGDEAVSRSAEQVCATAFEPFVGLALEASSLGIATLQPSEQSWTQDDREIACLATDPAARTTGSLQGSAR